EKNTGNKQGVTNLVYHTFQQKVTSSARRSHADVLHRVEETLPTTSTSYHPQRIPFIDEYRLNRDA
ncbi:hypothetical protein L9F63_002331, partial [Diploptera punctata]